MPFALILLGLLLFIAGIRGEHKTLAGLVQGDFTGPNNFFVWVMALGAIGALGYVKPMQKFSVAFMTLILIGIVLSHRGFFENFSATIQGIPKGTPTGPATETNTLPSLQALPYPEFFNTLGTPAP